MRKLKILLLCVFVIAVFMGVTVMAENDISVMIDGQAVVFNNAKPQLENNSTMVPMRAIFEKLGAKVVWSEKMQCAIAQKDESIIIMQVDNKAMTVIDEKFEEKGYDLNAAPMVKDGSVLVPVRDITEALGCYVYWYEHITTVSVTTTEQEMVTVYHNTEEKQVDKYVLEKYNALGWTTMKPSDEEPAPTNPEPEDFNPNDDANGNSDPEPINPVVQAYAEKAVKEQDFIDSVEQAKARGVELTFFARGSDLVYKYQYTVDVPENAKEKLTQSMSAKGEVLQSDADAIRADEQSVVYVVWEYYDKNGNLLYDIKK